MYLDDYAEHIYKWRKKQFTFNPSYRYWVNTLLEYPTDVLVRMPGGWTGLPA